MERSRIVGILTAICAIAVMFIYNAEYAKKDFDICTSTDNRIRVLYGLSLEKCVNECGRRPGCQRLNYKLARKECGLFNESYSIQSNEALKCAVVTREEIDPDKKRCHCEIGMACQKNGTCQYKECPPIPQMDPTRGVVKGNMQNIGAKVKIQCNDGYTRIPDRQLVVCGNDGQWGEIPDCLWNCNEPLCSRLPYTSDLSTGGTLEGDTRNYTCQDGLYVNDTSQSQNITIVCKRYGWDYGDISSQLCVNETFYPKRPENIVWVGCYVFEINAEQKTYSDSQSECEPYGDLLRVDSVNKQYVLNSQLGYDWDGPYWIQGKRTSDGWRFNDGTTIDLLSWHVSDDSGPCLTIAESTYEYKYGGRYRVLKWGGKSCDTLLNFICEYMADD